MIIREYGDPAARVMLVQPVGQHELPLIDDEIAQIGHMTDRPFRYLAVQVENWNRSLSPWTAPAGMRTSVTAQKHCLRKSCRFARSRIKTT